MVFFITVLFRITAIFAVVSLSRTNSKGGNWFGLYRGAVFIVSGVSGVYVMENGQWRLSALAFTKTLGE